MKVYLKVFGLFLLISIIEDMCGMPKIVPYWKMTVYRTIVFMIGWKIIEYIREDLKS